MNFLAKLRCAFCDKPNNSAKIHGHLLQCNSLREENKDWFAKLREALAKEFTPPNLRDVTLDRVYSYYESNLQDSKNEEGMNNNHRYDSLRESDEPNMKSRYQRIIIKSDSEHSTENESSLSSTSLVSKTLLTRRRLLKIKDDTSFTSEEYIFKDETSSIASKIVTPPISIELFHQNLDINSSHSKVTLTCEETLTIQPRHQLQ